MPGTQVDLPPGPGIPFAPRRFGDEIGPSMPRLSFGNWPTPVERLDTLLKELPAEIWVKRDDLSSREYGGNRVRQLEWLLSDVKRTGKNRILTFGGVGSNYIVAMAAFARKAGLRIEAVLVDQPLTPQVRTNLLLSHHFSARIHFVRTLPGAALAALRVAAECTVRDRRAPYVLRPGGATGIGSLGYAFGALELAEQIHTGACQRPDRLFVAVSSCGTIAGLLAGLSLAGLELPVIGVQAAESYVTNRGNILRTYARVMDLIRAVAPNAYGCSPRTRPLFDLCPDFLGGRYGQPVAAGERAVEIARERAGLVLEGTYTGKAFAAVLQWCQRPENEGRRAMFWNTYNSRDLSLLTAQEDWRQLPRRLWRYFDGTLPLARAKI